MKQQNISPPLDTRAHSARTQEVRKKRQQPFSRRTTKDYGVRLTPALRSKIKAVTADQAQTALSELPNEAN
jgi:hypothetical protein